MAENFMSRLKHAWNVFSNKDPTGSYWQYGQTYSIRPDRVRITMGNERTIVNSLITRIAIDASSIDIWHVKTNEDGNYEEIIKSGLNYCLTESANIDQTGRAFRQDVYTSLLDEGCIAVVPVDTSFNPKETGHYEINSLRVGKILEWMPKHIRVRLYNEETGKKEDVVLPKSICAIIENPFYNVMNEPNSTLKRLVRKLNILDYIDEQSSSGKLNMIIQLPYTVRNELKRAQAEERRSEVENQLTKSKYGVAYVDGTEKIVQLNRPLENNLLTQIEYLTKQLFSQSGITEEILNGTADEQTMINYRNETIEPLVSAVVDEFRRKFLTKTARTQLQNVMFFIDPFKLVPVGQIAEISDKLTRNEIMSSNEVRQKIGLKPSDDPRADELRNKNINQSNEELVNTKVSDDSTEKANISGGKNAVDRLSKVLIKNL